MTILLVALGGSIGAVSRYYLERFAVARWHERIPYGTAAANLIGALVLGVVAGLAHRNAVSHNTLLFIGTGFCGALTTFSGFMGQIETRARHAATRRLAFDYAATVFAVGLALAGLGYYLAA